MSVRGLHRRRALAAAAGALLTLATRPAGAAVLDSSLADAVRAWAGDGVVPKEGRVTLDIAQLVENGNAVPVTVRVESPMTEADHVREIVVFNEKNPQRDVVKFQLSPLNGRAEVSTRIRLANSQHLVALARVSDGSVWQHTIHVVVTLAACIDG